MASRKKNRPSTPNGNPSTAPYCRISPGHNRPISNDSTVPVTAPTAISTPIACDQRRASRIAVSSWRRRPMNSASSTIDGSAIPRHAKMMWNPSVAAICARAGTTSPLACAAATTTAASKRITAPSRSGKALPGLAELARHRGGRSGAVNQDPLVLPRLTGHDSRRRVSSARPCRASGRWRHMLSSATGQSGGCGAGLPDRAQTKDRRPECAAHRQIEYCICAEASPGLAARRRRVGRCPAPQLVPLSETGLRGAG